MKNIGILILLAVGSFSISAQNIMTIGQVFDYSIGDKFQISGKASGQPPNCDRITIIDKYYSINHDTVFYSRYHNSYESSIIWTEPASLEYVFSEKTDTIFYTNLDSLITSYWLPFDSSMYNYDTIIQISEIHCDTLINGYSFNRNPFEPISYEILYGKGLGVISDHYYSPADNSEIYTVLVYYEKNRIGCGTKDNTTISIPENSISKNLTIWPNPADNYCIINTGGTVSMMMDIFNNIGQIVDSQLISEDKYVYNCSHLQTGSYYIVFHNGSSFYNKVLMKK